MLTDADFQINSAISFSLKGSVSRQPKTYGSVKVLGTFGYTVARSFSDIDSAHAQIYPTLDKSVVTINNANSYNYLYIQTSGGDKYVIGIPWIDEDTFDSVTVVENSVTLTAPNQNTYDAGMNALKLLGITVS